MTALQELLAKVEAGYLSNEGSMFRAFGDEWTDCFDAYHGSLDAAKKLHEAVLPEYAFSLYEEDNGEFHCLVGNKTDVRIYEECWSLTPARAWLIAIIKALISEAEL